jgi:hypothetical protein
MHDVAQSLVERYRTITPDGLIRITVTVYRWFAGLSRRTTGNDSG